MKWTDIVCSFSARELRFCRGSCSVCHGVLLLAGCESSMALGAHFRADVITSRGVTLARPPSGFSQMFVARELLANSRRHLRRGHRHYKKHEKQFANISHNASQT